MRSLQIVSVPTALLLAVAACSSEPAPVATTSSPPTAEAITGGQPSAEATTGTQTAEKAFEDFDPNNFDHPTRIDNAWLPMKPGMRYVYEGTTVEDDGSSVPHRIELLVTDLTKVIGGVRTVVASDMDYSDDQLVEAELAFYAQDNDGNVWYLGEYPEEYEDGQVVAAPAWIHGLEDARAGIMMQADPQPGTPSYSEGWGPAVDWTDRGQVDQMGQRTCVPVDCYEDTLVIAETSRGESGASQLKHYARDVGNVRVSWRGADQTQEELELTEVTQLDPEALAEVRAKALELEKSAYENSKDVYVYTSPSEYPEGTPILAITPAATEMAQAAPPAGSATEEVVVYASDLPESALSEFEVWDDPASPGGELVGTPNTGGHLDPPPEDDPHVSFKVQVQGGIPYRCWIHMKVGAPQGQSQANLLWAQFSDAVDEAKQEAFRPGTASYLTAVGPARAGWAWVECDQADSEAEPLVYFPASGEVTVRLQAGMEGVGFDQFLLSPARFLDGPPSEAIVEK